MPVQSPNRPGASSGGLLDYGPVTAQYPQNYGLASAVNNMRQRNMANAQRGLMPYSASPGENPTGAGIYANSGLAGGMSNYGAQQNYAATGYMPNRTVGGAYGLGMRDPLGQNRLSGQQVLQQASGNQYRPIGNTGMGLAGAWYGGAQPGMVGGRQAWTGGGPTGAAVGPSPAEYFASKGYVDDGTGRFVNPAAPVGLGVASRPAAAPVDMASRSAALRQQRLGIYNTRQQNRVNAAQAQMEMMNPEYGLAMAQTRQQGLLAQGRLDVQREGLASQERIASSGLASKERGLTADREQRTALAKLQNEQAALQRLHELALQSGNHEAAAKVAAVHQANALKLAEVQGQTQRDIAKETHGYQRDEIQLKREALAQQRADSLRQQAKEAYDSGDIGRGQQLEQQATTAMSAIGGLAAVSPPSAPTTGTAPPPIVGLGLGAVGPNGPVAPRSWAQLPHSARASLMGDSPDQMLKNLRMSMPGLSQDEADRMVQEAYPGTTATSYNPSGYGLSDYVGGVTGLENIPRSIAWWSGRGPKPPSLWKGGPPIPVVPGLGVWQTRAGY
jgi:hypothetical protein